MLFFGILVLTLTGIAVWRTFKLVEFALDEIVEKYGEKKPDDLKDPYPKYRKKINKLWIFTWPPNANKILICLPVLLIALFVILILNEVGLVPELKDYFTDLPSEEGGKGSPSPLDSDSVE